MRSHANKNSMTMGSWYHIRLIHLYYTIMPGQMSFYPVEKAYGTRYSYFSILLYPFFGISQIKKTILFIK